MPITPQTNIRLLKTPFELDNKNQLTFATLKAQTTYFLSLTHIEEDNCTYQRKDNVIRFPAHIDTIIGYNYCMYQNENYSEKWFYAFITNMRYLNDNCTEISIATDVFQTWQFDFTFKASFVEREMIAVANDTPGANLLPESLETGEFIINNTIGSVDFDPVFVIAYADNEFTYGGTTYTFDGTEINGIPQAAMFILTNNLRTLLTQINADGKGDKVVTAFCIPKFCINTIVSSLVGDYVVPLTNTTYFEPIKDIIVGTKLFCILF